MKEIILSDGQKYEEITQNVYRRLKRDYPKTVNSFTARVRFKYFRLIKKSPEQVQEETKEKFKFDMLQIVAKKTAEIINEVNKLK